jgi:predicted AAA+ superfamily ATPase
MRDGYMLFMVNNFASKFSERETKHKFYFIDNGILNLYQSLNIESQLLENIVYLQLYREYGNTVFYYKNKYETDFYVPSENLLVQVAYHLDNNETMHREIRSFIKAFENLEVDKFLLVTYNEEEDTIREFDMEINVIPLLKFLLL